MMKNYDLIIVSKEYFPFGQAASNRIVCYAKALAKSKRVMYLCTAGPLYEDNWGNVDRDGVYDGVEFHYMGEVCGQRPSLAVRFARLIYRHLKLLYLLSFRYRAESVVAVNNRLSLDCLLKVICRCRGMRLFNEINETPLRKYPSSMAPVVRRISSIYDGFLIISPRIMEYFPNIGREKFFFLPMLVDPSRFDGVTPDEGRYMLYCSGGNLKRDGFLDILNGFEIFHSGHPEYMLKVATSIDISDEYNFRCKQIMDSHPDFIEYLGQVPTTWIPGLIMGSACLMVTPHRSYETAGFPTKLGEFFASSRPVIISSIPDLQMIPRDCVYLVEPCRADMIAGAMASVVSDPAEAERIGRNGRDYVVEQFTMKNITEPLIGFLGI